MESPTIEKNQNTLQTNSINENDIELGKWYENQESVKVTYDSKNVTVKSKDNAIASQTFYTVTSFTQSNIVDVAVDANYFYVLHDTCPVGAGSYYIDRYNLDGTLDTDNWITRACSGSDTDVTDFEVSSSYIFVSRLNSGGFPAGLAIIDRFTIAGSYSSSTTVTSYGGVDFISLHTDETYIYYITRDTGNQQEIERRLQSSMGSIGTYQSTTSFTAFYKMFTDDQILWFNDLSTSSTGWWVSLSCPPSCSIFGHSWLFNNEFNSGIASYHESGNDKVIMIETRNSKRQISVFYEDFSTYTHPGDLDHFYTSDIYQRMYSFGLDQLNQSSTNSKISVWDDYIGLMDDQAMDKAYLFYLNDTTKSLSVVDPTIQNMQKDDSIYSSYSMNLNGIYSFNVSNSFLFYDITNPTNLNIKYQIIYTNASVTDEELASGIFTLSISELATYRSEELTATLSVSAHPEGDNLLVGFSAFDTGILEDISDSAIINSPSTLNGTFTEFQLNIDYIWAESVVYETNIRSKILYTSHEQSIHQITVHVFDYRIPLKIYSNFAWNLTDIQPVATVNYDETGNYYYITNTLPLQYTIKFNSGSDWGIDYARKPFMGSWKDVSSYLSCPGFECGNYVQDWQTGESSSTHQADSISVNTSIVHQGSFSLRAYENTGSAFAIGLQSDLLDPGSHYISFSYYIESWDSGINSFEWYTSDTENNYLFKSIGGSASNPIMNRWVTEYIYFETDGLGKKSTASSSTVYDFFIYVFDSDGTVSDTTIFIDSFKIIKEDIQAETIDYNKFITYGHIINWDGILNPTVSFEGIHLKLFKRTTQEVIIEDVVTTDEQGYFERVFNFQLPQEEIEIRILIPSNTFGYTEKSLLEYGSSWVASSGTLITTDLGNGEWLLEFDNSGTASYEMTVTHLFDLSFPLYIRYDAKINSSEYIYQTLLRQGSTNNYYRANEDFIPTSSYSTFLTEFDNVVGTPETTWDKFMFYSTGGFPTALYIKNVYVIHYQSYYFTPIPSSYIPFSHETKENGDKNYWDFSEGTFEDFTFSTNTQNEDIVNGYYYAESNTAFQNEILLFTANSNIDTDYYTHLIFRAKTNDDTTRWDFLADSLYVGAEDIDSTDWVLYEINLSLDPDWTGTINSLRIRNYDPAGHSSTETYQIGFIYLIHKSSSQTQGFGWEFEEPNYLEDWEKFDGVGTIAQYDHGIRITATGSTSYVKIRDSIFNDVSDFDKIILRLFTSDSSAVMHIQTHDGVTTLVPSISIGYSSYTDIILDLSSTSSQGFSIRLSELDGTVEANDYYQIAFIRLFDSSQQIGLELDETNMLARFSNDNNSTEWYATWMNGSFWKIFEEGEQFQLEAELDIYYSFSYSQIYSDAILNFVQGISTIYSLDYQRSSDLEDLAIEGLKTPNFDTGSGLVDLFISTNWENTTITVYQNSTSLGSASEGSLAVFNFDNGPGIWNFTFVIDGGYESVSWTSWLTIVQDELSGSVHFDLTNDLGVGLNWEIVRVFINGSRIYGPDQIYPTGSLLEIEVLTHFNVTVLETSQTVMSNGSSVQDIALVIPLYLQYFYNNNTIPVALQIESGLYNITFVMQPEQSLSTWIIAYTYDLRFIPMVDEVRNATHIVEYYETIEMGVALPSDDGRISFSLSLDADELFADSKGRLNKDYFWQAVAILGWIIGVASSTLLAVVLFALMKYFGTGLLNALLEIFSALLPKFTRKRMRYSRDVVFEEEDPEKFEDTWSRGVGGKK